jgi:hypothetical protein
LKWALLRVDTTYCSGERCTVRGYDITAFGDCSVATPGGHDESIRIRVTRNSEYVRGAWNGMLVTIQNEPLRLFLNVLAVTHTLGSHRVPVGLALEAHRSLGRPVIRVETRLIWIHSPGPAESIFVLLHDHSSSCSEYCQSTGEVLKNFLNFGIGEFRPVADPVLKVR